MVTRTDNKYIKGNDNDIYFDRSEVVVKQRFTSH